MKITMTKAERENLARQIGETITRSAYEMSITTTGKKENTVAREYLEAAKITAKNINKDITDTIHAIKRIGYPLSEETELVKELQDQMVFIDIDDYEDTGIRDAEALKKSFGWERSAGKSRAYYDHKAYNSKMVEHRKAYRKDKRIYNAAAAKPRYDAELNLKGLTHLLETNGQEYADKRYDYVVTAIAEIETAGDQQAAEYFKAELQKIMDKYDYSPKATDIDIIDDYIVTQDAQFEAQAAEQAEADIATIHRKVEENPDLEMRAAVNHWMKSDNNTKPETIDTAKSPFTSEEAKLLDKIEKSTFDNIIYQHGNHESAHQAAINGDIANTELGKLAMRTRKSGDDKHFKLLFDEMNARIKYGAKLGRENEPAAGQYIRGELAYQPLGNYSIVLNTRTKTFTEGTAKIIAKAIDAVGANGSLQPTGKKQPIEFSKMDYANSLADAVATSTSARRRWNVYTIKNAANLKGFDDVRIAAQKVLDEGFDSFTVGDYINLTA